MQAAHTREVMMLRTTSMPVMACLLAATSLGVATVSAAAKKPEVNHAAAASLNGTGTKLEKQYAAQLKSLQAEVLNALPSADAQMQAALAKAREVTKAAEAAANAATASGDKINGAKGLVDHAKNKWIAGADKGIAQAEAALKKATNETERAAAKKDLAKWQANKDDGIRELKIRQAALDKALLDEANVNRNRQAAQEALAQARTNELVAAKTILTAVKAILTADKADAKLAMGAVLAEATPRGLAEFAQQGREQEALVEKLLADPAMMKDMLEAGGAKFGNYGRAIEIYAAILKASPKAKDGNLQRLALATSLEHAKPIPQSNPKNQTGAPATVDPVKRYLHYEKAFLAGELDPAFKNLSTWEYRLVVDCDAPDEILTWGREMLRNYRPDHIYNSNYGWRYVSAVKTEVPYGSQNVKNDLDSLQEYQNIIKDGGVCGRRAFFGRFILRCFGIPVWGVTQHAHAALSHWTPQGWVVNLGAGFEWSWWDKDESSRSGSDFLLETQARAHGEEFLKVLRAQWISRILGEQAYNDRQHVTGGFWSGVAHYQTVVMAAKAVTLGPLGQELAEANEPKGKETSEQAKAAEGDRKAVVGRDGVITIPAVAHNKLTGPGVAMKSFAGGMQVHASGGFKADYDVMAPRPGKYAVAIRVATAQEGQKFQLAAKDAAPVDIAVPYTLGMWQATQPVEVSLANGRNTLHLTLVDGSRGVAVKEITLTPVR